MSDLEERFSDALHSTSRSWRQAVDRRLKYLGVSQASWMTIAIAAKARSPLSQSELADKLGVEGATMVAMIDRLVKAGLVTREASTTDRRINTSGEVMTLDPPVQRTLSQSRPGQIVHEVALFRKLQTGGVRQGLRLEQERIRHALVEATLERILPERNF